eukprot:scaffold256111_cov33-Tisochrysis_lutea.AAC.3
MAPCPSTLRAARRQQGEQRWHPLRQRARRRVRPSAAGRLSSLLACQRQGARRGRAIQAETRRRRAGGGRRSQLEQLPVRLRLACMIPPRRGQRAQPHEGAGGRRVRVQRLRQRPRPPLARVAGRCPSWASAEGAEAKPRRLGA